MFEIIWKSFAPFCFARVRKKAGNRLEMIVVENWISQDPLETLFSERSSLGLGDML